MDAELNRNENSPRTRGQLTQGESKIDSPLAAFIAARSAFSSGHRGACEELATKSYEWASSSADAVIAIRSKHLLCKLAWNNGHAQACIDHALVAIELARSSGFSGLQGLGWVLCASGYSRLRQAGKVIEALNLAGRLLELAALEVSNPSTQAAGGLDEQVQPLLSGYDFYTAYTGMALSYAELGAASLAFSFSQKALSSALGMPEVPEKSIAKAGAYCNALLHAFEAYELAGVGQTHERTLERTRLLSFIEENLHPAELAVVQARSADRKRELSRLRGWIAMRQGQPEQAIEFFEKCVEDADQMPHLESLGSWIDLAEAQELVGNQEAKQLALEQAEKLYSNREQLDNRVPALLEARLACLRGESRKTMECLMKHHAQTAAALSQIADQRVAKATAELSVTTEKAELKKQNAQLKGVNENLASSVELMSHLASTDSLTSLFNRRALEEHFAVFQRDKAPVGFVIADLDHFKHVNDQHSHATGDLVLKKVAEFFQETLRQCDVVGRYGGEEFIFLISATQLEQASIVCERIRQRVEQFAWHTISAGLKVTVSFGVVMAQAHESFQDTLRRADRLLYEAKRSGRNLVVAGLLSDDASALHNRSVSSKL